MQITFGFYLDGAEWSAKPASLGEIACGPLQLLQLLEGRLGLSRQESPPPVRIDEYARKIALAVPDWCRKSYELDSWSTAKQLLAWRDELLENGWNGETGGSPRLEALAAIETKLVPFPPGRPERLHALLTALKGKTFTDKLILREPAAQLPSLWRQLVEILGSCGMQTVEEKEVKSAHPEIVRVDALDEMTLALQLARYLKSGDNTKVAVICEGDSHIVDGILHRFGFGALGVSEPSRWRESLQILPLWLETLWEPFHPQRFLELLLLPHSPIPRVVSRELIRALQEEPGILGDAWEDAWHKAEETIRKNERGFYNDINSEIAKVARLRELLEQESFNADTGVLERTLADRCDELISWLAPRVKDHFELARAISHAKTLKEVIAGKGIVDRVALIRILDSIISTGTSSGDKREVNEFAVFTHPGMVNRDFDTVIWWNFIDTGAAKSTYWTPAECKAVKIDQTILRKREARAWHNVLNHAQNRLICFVPQMLDGAAVFPHPLLDELKVSHCLKSENLTDDAGAWQLASRRRQLVPLAGKESAEGTKLEPNRIVPLRSLSHTQMHTFLSCPFQWFLKDYIGLNMPPAMNVPTGSLMIGKLAHKVVERLFNESKQWTPATAGVRARTLFDELVASMAAELLQAGRSADRHRLCTTLAGAVESLVREINDRHLVVKETEKELAGVFAGNDFVGYADIYLEDADGHPFIIDMKWSTAEYYEKNLHAGKALQLATYSHLIDPKSLDVQCAYFLYPKRKFIHDPDQDWKTLWRLAAETWEQRFATLHSGVLERGTDDEKKLKDALPLALTAGCAFCNYSALCGAMEE